jgi:hypothetical protein
MRVWLSKAKWFWLSIFAQFLEAGKWQTITTAKEECNKYDLTADPYF